MLVTSGLLTLAECGLVADGSSPLPGAGEVIAAGDDLSRRLIYDIATKPGLVALVERSLGPHLVLTAAGLVSGAGPGTSPVSTGALQLLIALDPNIRIGIEQLTLGAAQNISLAPGEGIVLPGGSRWSVSPPQVGRVLMLAYATPGAVAFDGQIGRKGPPCHEVSGNCWPASGLLPAPRRGPDRDFALDIAELSPLAANDPPVLLGQGKTDGLNLLRVWKHADQAPAPAHLCESLSVQIAGAEQADALTMDYRPAGETSPSDTAAGTFVRLEWVAAPLGYANPIARRGREGEGLVGSTVFLSKLSVEQRALQSKEQLSLGILPGDTIVLLVGGHITACGHDVSGPGLNFFPAGTRIDVENVGPAAARVVLIHLQARLQELHAVAPVQELQAKVVFGIPLVSRAMSKDWDRTCALLETTLHSIYAQTNPHWHIIVVGSDAPDLPLPLDSRFEFISTTRDLADGSHNGALADQGYKLALAERYARARGGTYFFPCDADDLLSERLVDFIVKADHPYGYVVQRGYLLDTAARVLAPLPIGRDGSSFDQWCASCVAFNLRAMDDIVSSDVTRYGHVGYRQQMYLSGRPLLEIPFAAACYRQFTGTNLSDLRTTEKGERSDGGAGLRRLIKDRSIPIRAALAGEFCIDALDDARDTGATFGPKRLSVLVCTHKRPGGLAKLLKTLMPQIEGHADRELIVVNDGTDGPGYADVIAPYRSALRYEPVPKAGGVAHARNRSAELARGEYLVFTDDDCEVPAHWLDWLEATLRSQPELGAVAGTTSPPKSVATRAFLGKVQAHYQLLPRPRGDRIASQTFVTACLAVRASVFRNLGGFSRDEALARGGEDTELSLRMATGQIRLKVDWHWHVFHALAERLSDELNRFRQYGVSNAHLARHPYNMASLAHLKGLRLRVLPSRFLTHFRETKARAEGFSDSRMTSVASRLVVALIETSYDLGACLGRR